MKRIIKPIIVIFVLILLPNITQAQQFDINIVKSQMIKDWTRAKSYTLDYLNAMPADKYGFKPVNSVTSFAEQMIHLAVTNSFLVFMASDKNPPEFTFADINSRINSHSKDSVYYYVSASYDYCISSINSLSTDSWGTTNKLSNQTKTRYEFLQNAFEHQTHHRGQTTIYLRLQKIIPPEANLF